MNGEGRADIGGIYMDTDGYGKREERGEEEVSEPMRELVLFLLTFFQMGAAEVLEGQRLNGDENHWYNEISNSALWYWTTGLREQRSKSSIMRIIITFV